MDKRLKCMVGLLTLATAVSAAKPQVKIRDGKLAGTFDEAAQVYAFKGIPYALPPVGGLRWSPPQPEEGWKGVREAKEFGSSCMQAKIFADMIFAILAPAKTA